MIKYSFKNRFCLILTLLVLVVTCQAYAEFEAVKDYKFLKYSEKNLQNLTARIKVEKVEALKELKKKYADKPQKADEHAITLAYQLLLVSAEDIQKRAKSGEDTRTLALAFSRLQRLHYSVRADIDPYSDPSFLILAWKCGSNYLFGPLKLRATRPDFNKRTGLKNAFLEAENLFKQGATAPLSREELANLTPRQVSKLVPSSDHHAMRPVKPGNHYDAFLKEMAEAIKATAGKKAKNFDFAFARRIMFFDELKESASSPKIMAKDRYGLKWKIKWGDEVHSDVVASRLAIDLGATYADIKFYSGPGETLLILGPAKDRNEPANQPELARMLLKSKFGFHLNRYVVDQPFVKGERGEKIGTGLVDEKMLEQESLDRKYLGCVYLAFKEAQLTLDNPALKRLGGIDLTRGNSVDDRVARSLVVFSTWIRNPDVKEDNARGGLLWNNKTQKFDKHVEFISDMGASFAGPYSSGCLSTLSNRVVGEVFNQKLFKFNPVFLPNSWQHCTWADARWMARRIAGLNRADLERVFAQSGWPAFSQQLGVEKMLARRNDLVKSFELEEEGIKIIDCNPRLTIKVKTDRGIDMPVILGKINPFSRLVIRAEKEIHPEGLLISRPRQLD